MKNGSAELAKESFIQGVLKKINSIFTPGSASMDDFDWQKYHCHYQAELAMVNKVHTQVLSCGDYVFSDGALFMQGSLRPLHPNHRLLYETILQLNPGSVFEFASNFYRFDPFYLVKEPDPVIFFKRNEEFPEWQLCIIA